MFNMGILQGSISMHRVNKLMPKTFQEGLKQKNGVNLRFCGITACSKQCLSGQKSCIWALRSWVLS